MKINLWGHFIEKPYNIIKIIILTLINLISSKNITTCGTQVYTYT